MKTQRIASMDHDTLVVVAVLAGYFFGYVGTAFAFYALSERFLP